MARSLGIQRRNLIRLPTDRKERLEALTRLHAAWENVWLAARANPQWTARNAERRATEARSRRAALRMIQAVTQMFGPPGTLARLGRRLWSRTGKALDPSMVRALSAALMRQVSKKKLDTLKREIIHELARGAERSERSARAQLKLPERQPWREREGFRKQTSEWTDVEGVFVHEYPELVNEIDGTLATAVGSHADQVSRVVVRAADPSRPLAIGQVSREIRQVMPGMSVKRANMIARTETGRVYGKTTHAQYERNGIERRRVLTASGSPAAAASPVCKICIDMAAQGMTATGDSFNSRVSNVRESYPPFHPNCRCDTAADTAGWLPPMEDLGEELDPWYGEMGGAPGDLSDVGNRDRANQLRDKLVARHGNDPKFKRMQGFLDTWGHDSTAYRQAASQMLSKAGETTAISATEAANVKKMLDTIKKMPRIKGKLYRGLRLRNVSQSDALAKFAVGTDVDVSLSSASFRRSVAMDWAEPLANKPWTSVIYELESAQGLPIGSWTPIATESEAIISGRFQVTAVRWSATDNAVVVKMRQTSNFSKVVLKKRSVVQYKKPLKFWWSQFAGFSEMRARYRWAPTKFSK